jgi:hypothetical protein
MGSPRHARGARGDGLIDDRLLPASVSTWAIVHHLQSLQDRR